MSFVISKSDNNLEKLPEVIAEVLVDHEKRINKGSVHQCCKDYLPKAKSKYRNEESETLHCSRLIQEVHFCPTCRRKLIIEFEYFQTGDTFSLTPLGILLA